MTLKTAIIADAANILLNEDEFAESLVWTPAGGEAQTLTALVKRDDAQQEPTEDGLEIDYWATVRLAASAVAGIARNDKLTFAAEVGGTAVDWTIASQPVNHGAGLVSVRAYRRAVLELANDGLRRPIR